ncbi:MAG TPA: protein kinase [Thermoanaerobaculia bacterium]|nr:protein kinase [Thermoanaerobaculia bacterium]
MTVAAGTRLGPYEIQSPLGAGGMGEVYRARDTRLGRTVAIKVLPSQYSSDPELRERFEREAKTISSLSHSHICALYDVGREGEVDYLVMEYLEGETLSARLGRGVLPTEQVLRFGTEIADALDKAHRQGIVHRDLKPGNVMLTKSGVKLLDFGLAKAFQRPLDAAGRDQAAAGQHPMAGQGLTAIPTVVGSPNLTQAGTILGTFQYMAPEQLEGREADTRTDIFALGAVLYEMATGRKAFSGATQASLISSILRDEPPPISQVATMAPPALDRVVKTCLAKDPEERWQSAGDVGKELRWIAEGSAAGVAAPVPVSSRRRNRERIAWMAAAAASVLAVWLGLSRARPGAASSGRVLRTNVLLPEKLQLNNAVISPDGGRIVFSGIDSTGKVQLWLRSFDSYSAAPVAGTDGAILPFWSPDGKSLGFFADKKLKRVDVSGGAPIILFDVDGVGGAWGKSGDILFTPPAGPVYRLPATGGKAVEVTKLDASRQEKAHRYPFFLPDGKHFLYLALNVSGNSRDPANRIWVGSVDGSAAKPLIQANFNAQYSNGYLFFIRGGDLGGSLLAQPFDPARLETSGDPVTVADQISLYGDFLGFGDYSVSENGPIVFDAFRLVTRLEWFDRSGKRTGAFGEPATHFNPRISPDGSRIAFDLYDAGTQKTQIWVGDISRGVQTRLTSGSFSNSQPIWSPDGSRIAFQSDRKHQADAYVKAADGSGADEAITDNDDQRIPNDWSPDGKYLSLFDRQAGGDRLIRLSAVPVSGDHKVFVVIPPLPNFLGSPRFSPDGRWLAYDTDESGRSEVYVISFPEGQNRVQISNAGGSQPRWARHGKEILYTGFDGKVMSVDIDSSHGIRPGPPRPLFQLPEGTGFGWDVSADGERFLLNVPVIKSSSVPLSVVVNWAAGLKK